MVSLKPITIMTPRGKRIIGPGHPSFIIAEMSGNHQQDYRNALRIIDAAVEAEVDAVKIQTYTADTMTIDSDKEPFQIRVNDAWKGQTLYSLYQTAYTPWEWQPDLKKYAESKGLLLFSTPFDETSVDFLEKMNVSLYKVASFETGHIPLLKKIGRTRKPVIISRGLSSYKDLSLAVRTLRAAGCPQVAVLHCVSSYPAVHEQMHLATIPDLCRRFRVITGLSDHSLGSTVALTSVALGARIIEKHLTISRAEGGPDAGFSLEPQEFQTMVRDIRNAEAALGSPQRAVEEGERENIVFRRSIFVVRDIRKGEKFSKDNIRVIRPGQGLSPVHYESTLGRESRMDLERGTPLERGHIAAKRRGIKA
jgi:pseudaminic acid synthase